MKSIFLKTTFFMMTLMLLCATTIQAQNSLKVDDVAAGPGEKSNITIELNNTADVVGFQFTLTVPSGLIVSEKAVELTTRKGDQVVYPQKINSTQYQFISFSPTNTPFSGNSGALLQIPIELPIGFQPGTNYPLSLSGVILSSAAGVDIGSGHQSGTLTVGDAKTPDLEVSGVTVSDAAISPNGTISVSWGIKNAGNAAVSSGGWTEQVSLVSDQTGSSYLLGSISYTGDLAINETVSRSAKFNIPAIVGMDGAVKAQVNVIPNSTIKELDSDKANNTALSSASVPLSKAIFLSFNNAQTDENAASPLRATLTRSGFRSASEDFQIACSMDNQLAFPATVTIGAGQSAVAFDVQPIDNSIADGNRTVTVTASGNAYTGAAQDITIIDDEVGTVTLISSQSSATDGDALTITLQTDIARTQDATFTLTADQPARWSVPATVVLPAGSKSVTFQVGITSQTTVQQTVTGNITAKADGYKSGTIAVSIVSANIPAFDFTISPNSISEGDGTSATYAVINRLTNSQVAVTLQLTADLANQLILPTSVNFPAGVAQQKFNIGAVDNSIVDGTRTVTITASVYLPSCNCTTGAGASGANLSQTITILDNDGLALNVNANPSTVKAGLSNAAKITISRNTVDLSQPVNLQLSCDMPSVVSIPATAVIPAGQASVDVTINTIIDPSKKGDQTVRIQADADSYTSGFGWILISDQNKPDAAVTNVAVNSTLAGGGSADVKATISNFGNTVLTKGSKIEYYLSPDKTAQNGTLLATDLLTDDINAGSSSDFTKTIQLPDKAGNYYLIVVVNSDQKIAELNYTNNQGAAAVQLTPAYTATVAVNKTVYKSEETVVVSGTATLQNGSPAANKDIEVIISNNSGFVRTATTTTNGSGGYTYSLQPLPGESGHYTVTAGYPGAANPAKAEFDIAGFVWTNKPASYLIWEVVQYGSFQGEFVLKNNTNINLSNVKIVIPGTVDFTIAATPVNIPAGQTVSLAYTITPGAPTAGRDYVQIPLQLVSDEGASLSFTGLYYCHPQTAQLMPDPVSIVTTMTKGASRYYNISLINGAIEAKDVKINLPSLDWMTLVSPQTIASVAPYDTVTVTLQLTPTDQLQLNVPLSGTIAVGLSNGNGLQVPFQVTPVSESTGSIQVDATDDYTYNTASAPHLAGAAVTVTQPFSGAIVAQGTTGSDGLFTADNIPEGYYTMTVTADKHKSYQSNILVDPGKVNSFEAILFYQAVSYTWTVTPTEVQDQYQTDLVASFETNVPRPVVILDVDTTTINLQPGESKMLNMTLTNYGLVVAADIYITAPTADGYTFTLLTDYLPTLNAKSSVTVPLLVQRNSSELRSGGIADCVKSFVIGTYLVWCASEKNPETFACNLPFQSDGSCPGWSGSGGVAGWAGWGYPSPGGSCANCVQASTTTIPGNTVVAQTMSGCDPETWKKVIALLSMAGGPTGSAAAVASTMMSSDGWEAMGNVSSIVLGAIGSDLVNALTSLSATIAGQLSSPKNSPAMRADASSFTSLTAQDFSKLADIFQATYDKAILLIKDPNYLNNPDFDSFMKEVSPYLNLDNPQSFPAADILAIKNNLASTSISNDYIDSFCNRWNQTLEAWGKGIKSSNDQYPDIIDRNQLDTYDSLYVQTNAYITERGFTSPEDMWNKDYADLSDYLQQNNLSNSVCATVSVKFSQTITMTREAFQGTLTLNNGNDDGTITNVNLNLAVYDENGNDATYLFQINKDDFLNGTGSVDGNSSGTGNVMFIPTKQAAPTVPLSYSFGGTLSYTDPLSGENVTIQLYPVTLEVDPSPDLVLHYFLQRDILGDDPLTEDVVEPSVPAELALLIQNDGYGAAKNVTVQSMQPQIVDNQKGLLIDFTIVGSSFNNEPKQMGLLNVNYGTIDPLKSAVGEWWFTSTLMGHFVDYQINVTHLSSYGNTNLSLIKDYQVHELIKSVKAYGAGQDDVNDFLVNDIPDINDTPDGIYYSNGGSDAVYPASDASSSNAISSAKLTATLAVTPYLTGWNYGNIDDPGSNKYKLVKVVRNSDNYELPLENFWQTFVTMRDGKNPLYENKLHFLDKMTAAENYTLYYTPVDTGYPQVVAFENVPADPVTQPLENITVKFNKPIDVNTFTTNNLQLIYQGNIVPADNILIGKIDSVTYSLDLQTATIASGYYQLTVQCAGIKDMLGNEGQSGKSASWIQVMGELAVMSFTTDQVKSLPVNSVALIFNQTVAPNQFTKDKITLNGEPLGNDVSIITDDNLHYTIVGLSAYNNQSGSYDLSLNLPAVKSENNIDGLVVQSCKWVVDVVTPAVKNFTPVYQGSVNSQNVTGMQLTLTKPLVNDMNAGWITLYKGGVNQNAALSVTRIDSITYLVNGLGVYTSSSGSYELSVDQSAFTDALGNTGVGQATTAWGVSLVKPAAPTGMKITPDRGVSNTDNITCGDDLSISLATNANQQTVALYSVSSSVETLVKEQYVENAGTVNIPVAGYGGNTAFKAVARDQYGNESDPVSINVFIDNQDLNAEITPVMADSGGCSGELSYISVLFTDDIVASEFTAGALTLSAGGASLPTGNIVITPVSDKEFKLENPGNINNNGNIMLSVDLSGLHKKASGLQGKATVTQNLGNISVYSAQITGNTDVITGDVSTYAASPDMLDYSWSVTGGDMVASELNSVSVQWYEIGNQTITLTYTTPNNCVKTSDLQVQVSSGTGLTQPPAGKVNVYESNGFINVTSGASNPIKDVAIYSLQGVLIYRESSLNTISFTANKYLTTGVYIVKVVSEKGIDNDKVVVK